MSQGLRGTGRGGKAQTARPRTLFSLEPYPRFLSRVVELNRLHNPDDRLHDFLHLAPEAWQDLLARQGAEPGTEVARASEARKSLHALHSEFPSGSPLPEQAAYLVRGFAGLQPFGEGNHQTGWDYTAELMSHHGHELLMGSEDGRGLGNDLWTRLESAYPQGFTRRNLLDRDETFAFLADWFRHRIA